MSFTAFPSDKLEALGSDTFLPPEHFARVHFEYLIRYQTDCTSLPLLTGIFSSDQGW